MFGGPAPGEINFDLIPASSLFLSRRKGERQVEGGSWLGGRFCQGNNMIKCGFLDKLIKPHIVT